MISKKSLELLYSGDLAVRIHDKTQLLQLCIAMDQDEKKMGDGSSVLGMVFPRDTDSIVLFKNKDSDTFTYDSSDNVNKDFYFMNTHFIYEFSTLRDVAEEIKNEESNQVVEEASTIKNEVSTELPTLRCGSVKEAVIEDTNILTYKTDIIAWVNQYKNIVITEDNYKDIKKKVADINSEKKNLDDQKKRIKEACMKQYIKFESDVKEIKAAFDEVMNNLNNEISIFTQKEEDERRKQREDYVNECLKLVIETGALDEETSKEFKFDEKWIQKKYDPNKSGQKQVLIDEVEKELTRISDLYERKMSDIENVKSSVQVLCENNGINPESLGIERYVSWIKKGESFAEVMKQINQDVKTITQVAESKAKEEVHKQEQMRIDDIPVKQAEPKVEIEPKVETRSMADPEIEIVKDDSNTITFETTAKSMKREIADMDCAFQYTYSFTGKNGTLKALNDFMKYLKSVDPTFTYTSKSEKRGK